MKKYIFGILALLLFTFVAYSDNDTVPARSAGQIISATHMNVIRNALKGVFFPRNSSGVVTDIAGDLGSSSYRWNDASIKRILLGDSASNIQLKDNSGVLEMLVAGNTVVSVNSTGQSGAYLRSGTIPVTSLANRIQKQDFTTSNSNWTIPTGVQSIYVQMCGSGGGGGAGGSAAAASNSDGGGGGGGSSGQWIDIQLSVVGITSVAVSIGAAGAGGAKGTGGSDNANPGAAGNATTLTFNDASLTISAAGGVGGAQGTHASPGLGGAGGDSTAAFQKFSTDGGAGHEGDDAVNPTVADDGTDSATHQGGTGAQKGQDSGAQSGGGGGGGGGATNFANGGNGGNGGDAASSRNGYAGTAGTYCSGGGGGGGGSSLGAGSVGGDGGAGGPGFVRIWYF